MAIKDEVAAGVAEALAPIAEHVVAAIGKQLGSGAEGLKAAMSGKKIHIECDITLPDFTK